MLAFKEVDVSSLQSMLDRGLEGLLLVDVRQPAEVARGAIPGAQNIPLGALPQALEQLTQAGQMVIYCQSGMRSAQACAFLAANGISAVANLRGGIVAWAQAGGAIV